MALFRYQAIDASGKMATGTHPAEIIQEVEEWLVSNGMSPVKVEIAGAGAAGGASTGMLATIRQNIKETLTGVRLDDLIMFCRQTSTLLAAGVAALPTLDLMANQTENITLRKAIASVSRDIEGGTSLSEAFAYYPKIFNKLFLNIIRIGEETGNLDNSFDYLAGLYENEKDINERIKAATRYPKIVIVAIVGAIIFLMTFVVPKFVSLFSGSKVALPLPTRILILVSNFFANNFWLLTIAAVLLVPAWRRFNRQEFVILAWNRWALKIPVFGDLSLKIYMSRFARVLAILIKSGIDIISALRLSASSMDNIILQRMVVDVSEDVEEGLDLNAAMAKQSYFPPMVVQMVAVGEETGEISALLDKVADFYETETDYTIKNLATLIEPFLLLFLGIVVAFIALAIFMPMWNMMNVMKG